jgi:flagellar hook-length control protein FliK
MIQLPSALLEPPAPAPAKRGKEMGSHPPSPPDTPFAAVLDDQARTAVAEGHKRSDEPRVPVGDREPHEPPAESGDDASTDPAANAALAALLGGVPLPAVVAPAVATSAQAGAAAETATTTPEIPAQPVLPGAAAAGEPGAMPTGPSVPTAATTLPLRPVAGPSAPTASDGQPSSPAADATQNGAAASATRLADVLQSAAARPGGTAAPGAGSSSAVGPAATAIPAAATVAGTAAQGSAGGSADGFGGTPAQTAPPAPTPVAAPAAPPAAAFAPATPAAAAAARGVGLEQAVETVRLALRAGADRGVSHARISLTPRELGGIEVHLRQTADGLVARVVAEHATAAQLLQHAGGELRRSLEAQGLSLLRLDIGSSGEQSARNGDRRALTDGSAEGDRGRGTRGDDDPLAPLDGASAADLPTTTTTLALPNGAIVDVLA